MSDSCSYMLSDDNIDAPKQGLMKKLITEPVQSHRRAERLVSSIRISEGNRLLVLVELMLLAPERGPSLRWRFF